jgi:DNA-binding NarL/FixJ family response regulator
VADRLERISEQLDLPSDRQLEIARLVALGRSSKEVASELVVSARTVDNHLAAIYRNLGISSRTELADLPF